MKNKVFGIQVHDTIFQVKFPPVSRSCNLKKHKQNYFIILLISNLQSYLVVTELRLKPHNILRFFTCLWSVQISML